MKRFFRLEGFEQHLALHRMDCLARSGYLEPGSLCGSDAGDAGGDGETRPLITGRDLIVAGFHLERHSKRCSEWSKTRNWKGRSVPWMRR